MKHSTTTTTTTTKHKSECTDNQRMDALRCRQGACHQAQAELSSGKQRIECRLPSKMP